MSGKRVLSHSRKKLFKGHTPAWMLPRINRQQEARERQERSGANFMVGGKQVHLPNFHIEMQRKNGLGPKEAMFQVPLHFSKLDLKDLLWHAYGVQTHAISSFVTPSKVQPVIPGSNRDIPGKQTTFLPRGKKKMIVQLEKPFTWPSAPDFDKSRAEGKLDKTMADKQNEQKAAISNASRRRAKKREQTADMYDAMIDRATEVLREDRDFRAPPEKEDEDEKKDAKKARSAESKTQEEERAAAQKPTEPSVAAAESTSEPTPEPRIQAEVPLQAQEIPRTGVARRSADRRTADASKASSAGKNPEGPPTEHEKRVHKRAALLHANRLMETPMNPKARSRRRVTGIEL